MYLIKHSNSAFEGLKNSINIGGDVDSLDWIVVGILAGKHGIDDLPKYMIDNVEGTEYLKELAKKFDNYLNNE